MVTLVYAEMLGDFSHKRELLLTDAGGTPDVEYAPGNVFSSVEECTGRMQGLTSSMAEYLAGMESDSCFT